MKNNSLWSEYLEYKFNSLTSDIETDILIIGGGIAGIMLSFYLKSTKLKVTLVERNTLLSGVSSKMTAKVTILEDLLTKIKSNYLNIYIKSKLEGLNLLKKNINDLNIDCNFLESESFLYTNKKSNIKKLKKLENTLKKLNINFNNKNIPLDELKSLYSISINDSYTINIIKYLNKIIESLDNENIYENTNIIEVIKNNKYYIAKTMKYNIKSKIVIFANNYPYFIKPLLMPLKVRLEKSYILYGTSKYNGNYNLINIDKKVNSIRFYNQKMLYLTNSKYISHVNNKDYNNLNNYNLIKNIDDFWTNMDLITNDYLPIIGKLYNNMYILTGFNTWGILTSHIGSKIISNMILKNKKYLKYQELYNPRRNITMQKVINSSVNILENINGYCKGFIKKNKMVYYNKEYAIYIDSKMHKVKRKCPHLKCNLIFNEKELTWDCPCHGSKFNLDGKVINGPSKYDIG